MIEQSRIQQVTGLLADRSFGDRSTNIQVSREERDLRISQAQQNITTYANRSVEMVKHAAEGVSRLARLGGESAPFYQRRAKE
ncbi:MAG: hypothetical protein U0Y68_02850 [Blastocatellia bacterium]